MPELDLDQFAAARSEVAGEPPKVIFKGEKLTCRKSFPSSSSCMCR